MADRDEKLADAVATGLVAAVLTAALFILKVAVTVVVRVFIKYPRHPVILGTTLGWILAVLVAVGIGTVGEDAPLALWVAAVATITGLSILGVTETVLDQQALHHPASDETLTQLRQWWE